MLTNKTSIKPNVLFLLCDFQVSDLLGHNRSDDIVNFHMLCKDSLNTNSINIIRINIGFITTSLHTMKYR
jgi:hypothetical protein